MRVLVFMSTDISFGGGSPIRARLIIQGLNSLGVKVAVVSWKIPSYLIEAGVEFCPLSSPSTFLETIVEFGKHFKPDFCYGITEGFADVVLKASRILGCACGFDVHAIGIFEILELGHGYGPRLERLSNSIRWISAYKKADFLTVNPPKLISVMKHLNKNAYLVGSMVDLAHFSPTGDVLELDSTGRTRVLYAGNFLKWQGCPMLLEAAEKAIAADLPYQFTIIVTLGVNLDITKHKISIDRGLINFLEPKDYAEIPAYLRSADILAIPRPSMWSTNYAIPNKLGDYMASGQAVLATDIYPHRHVIQDGVTGVLCPPNSTGLLEGLLRLSDANYRAELGRNAREYAVQNFDYRVVSQSILNIMNKHAF